MSSGNMADGSAEILFRCFLRKAGVKNSGMGRDVHSLMLSSQNFHCWQQCHPPSKVPWRMVLERMLWYVTCPNHASFCLWTVARRGSRRPTRKLILLRTQSLVLCSNKEMQRSSLRHLTLYFYVKKLVAYIEEEKCLCCLNNTGKICEKVNTLSCLNYVNQLVSTSWLPCLIQEK